MPRPRLPQEVAKVTGADRRSPGRFKGRATPKVDPLGAPPKGFTKAQKDAWKAFADELPWLAKSDRAMLQVACRLRAAMETEPEFPISGYAQLRMCLSAMGGTPTDRTKVASSDGEEEDPADAYLN